jgi:predicted amidohydrolase
MSTLSVTILQTALHWHQADENRRMFDDAIDAVPGATDLVVLPEMFTTGFSMDAPRLAESMDGETIRWMRRKAATVDAAICGSLIIEEGGEFYNRFVCLDSDGTLHAYDKRHLFRLANEQHHYCPGQERITFNLKGFRLCPLVCYDLRFPVWSRNRDDYDVLIYVANWPSRRHHAWETLLRARAIENLCYVVGVNRVGTDGNDLPYAGGSVVVDYLGQDMANLDDRPGAATATLDLEQLRKFRERFAFHRDADDFDLR